VVAVVVLFLNQVPEEVALLGKVILGEMAEVAQDM
jgi:hypothetical protein